MPLVLRQWLHWIRTRCHCALHSAQCEVAVAGEFGSADARRCWRSAAGAAARAQRVGVVGAAEGRSADRGRAPLASRTSRRTQYTCKAGGDQRRAAAEIQAQHHAVEQTVGLLIRGSASSLDSAQVAASASCVAGLPPRRRVEQLVQQVPAQQAGSPGPDRAASFPVRGIKGGTPPTGDVGLDLCVASGSVKAGRGFVLRAPRCCTRASSAMNSRHTRPSHGPSSAGAAAFRARRISAWRARASTQEGGT